jgi:alkylhydroperoxidase family enzyme
MMQRLNSVNVDTAQGQTKDLFENVQDLFGLIPNAVKVMANSPAVLESFLSFSTAMGKSSIGEKLHNQVKLSTSESNSCDYCTSLLTAVAPSAGLSAEDILAGRTGSAEDEKTQAALSFAELVLEKKGKVGDQELKAIRTAGFHDTEIVEIVASVVLGCFTNFLNNVAETELDFPKTDSVQTCSAGSDSQCSTNHDKTSSVC